MTSGPDAVCVFGPSTFVTVTAERGADGDEVHFHAGGQGFWIARLLARLGVPTLLHTVLGGESGVVARALVEEEAIELRAVHSSEPSGSWVHDRRSGERRPVAEDAGATLGRHVVDELYGATLAAAMDAGICVVAGPHAPEVIDPDPFRRLCGDLRRNGVTVIADLSGEHLLAALDGGVDFCKVSHSDLASTEGFDDSGDTVDDLRRLADAGARHVAITRAAEPLVALVDGVAVEVATPDLEAVDHRGAGDAFTAVVAAAHFWGLSWLEAVRWGAAAGMLTVTRRGLATADRQAIHQVLGRVTTTELATG